MTFRVVCSRLVTDDRPSLVDEPARVRVEGVQPGQRVRLVARVRDAARLEFVSDTTFQADVNGVVDVAVQAPVAGSYSGVDPFGIWWSMSSRADMGFALGVGPVSAQLDVSHGASRVATFSVARLVVAGGVRIERVAEGAVVGALYVPARHPAPAVIVLGGSSGGLQWSSSIAALLASRGFTAFACAYFAVPGRPPTLTEVPLEDVGAALRWLLRRSEVCNERVAVVGRSRGGELALQVAALYEEAGPVVGFSASGLRWTGHDPASSRPRSAWSWRGRALPYLVPDQDAVEAAWQSSPIALCGAFDNALQRDADVHHAAIPVENITAPVLLVSGADDRMWPAQRMAEIALARRKGLRAAREDEHLVFAEAGHSVGQPAGLPLHDVTAWHALDRDTYLLGGTRAANAQSGAVAWPRMLQFLQTHLGGPDRCGARSTSVIAP